MQRPVHAEPTPLQLRRRIRPDRVLRSLGDQPRPNEMRPHITSSDFEGIWRRPLPQRFQLEVEHLSILSAFRDRNPPGPHSTSTAKADHPFIALGNMTYTARHDNTPPPDHGGPGPGERYSISGRRSGSERHRTVPNQSEPKGGPRKVPTPTDEPPPPSPATLRAGRRGVRHWTQQLRSQATLGGIALVSGLAAATCAEIWLPAVAGTGISMAATTVASVSGNLMASTIEEVWRSLRTDPAATDIPLDDLTDLVAQAFEQLVTDPTADRATFMQELDKMIALVGVREEITTEPDLNERLQNAVTDLAQTLHQDNQLLLAQIRSGQDQLTAYAAAHRAGAEQLLRLEELVHAELRRLRSTQPPVTTDPGPEPPPSNHNPYPGLRPFGPAEAGAGYFHGRDRTLATLLTRLAAATRTGTGLLIVTGASGVGKTSLLAAGLVPALRAATAPLPEAATWPVVRLAPGHHPIDELAVHLCSAARIAATDLPERLRHNPTGLRPVIHQILHRNQQLTDDPTTDHDNRDDHVDPVTDRRVLVIVDQAEELFTQGCPPTDRAIFLDALLDAATTTHDRASALIILSFRADFYPAFAAHPSLTRHLEDHQLVVPPLTREHLRQAIEEPAAHAGITLDPDLTTALLDDCTPESLPLLAHTLRHLYHRRENNHLSLATYRTTGGLAHAVTTTAETLYESLDPDGRTVMRQLLLSLISIGEGTLNTRDRIPNDLLLAPYTDRPHLARTVLDHLTDQRLITTDQNTTTLSHEAIITTWPRLQQWLAQDRTGLHLHQELRRAATTWHQHDDDTTLLWAGTRLETITTWVTDHPSALTALDQAFLDASRAQQNAADQATRRRTRNLRITAAVLAALLATTSFLAVTSFRQTRSAHQARDTALAREITTRARELLPTDIPRAALLALQAHTLDPGPDTEALLTTVNHTPLDVTLTGHGARITDVATSPNGRLLATSSADGTTRLWDATTATPLKTLFGHNGEVGSVTFSPDSALLATTGSDHTVRIWDTTTADLLHTLEGHTDIPTDIAFSPDGTHLASTGGRDGTLRIWDTSDGSSTSIRTNLGVTGSVDYTPATPGHPDGQYLVVTATKGLLLCDPKTGRTTRTLGDTQTTTTAPGGLAVAADGHLIATHAADSDRIDLWDTTQRTAGTSIRTDPTTTALAFSPDSRTLAVATGPTVELRKINQTDTATTTTLTSILTSHDAPVRALAFSNDGTHLLTGSDDATATLKDTTTSQGRLLTRRTDLTIPNGSSGALLTPDLRTLILRDDPKHQLLLEDPADQTVDPTVLAEIDTDRDSLLTTATTTGKTADQTRIAAIDSAGTTRIWPLPASTDDAEPPAAITLDTSSFVATALALGPTGQLAIGGYSDTVAIWDSIDGHRVTGLTVPDSSGTVETLDINPATGTLAAGTSHAAVLLWQNTPQNPDSTNPQQDLAAGEWDPQPSTLTGHTAPVRSVEFSPDGSLLASGGDDQTVIIRDAVTGQQLRTLTGHTATVNDIAFSPDGRLIATASADGSVRLWDTDTGTQIRSLPMTFDDYRTPTTLTFAPDGDRLGIVSTSPGTGIQIWNIQAHSTIDTLCAQIGRTPSDDERATYLTDASACP